MVTLHLILQVVALVCLFLAAFSVPFPPRMAVGWLGMALWLLSELIAGGAVLLR